MAACVDEAEEQAKKRRRIWTKEWLLDRPKYSNMELLEKLHQTEPLDFQNFLRMDIETFEALLDLVTPYIKKAPLGIPPEVRPAIPPRFHQGGAPLGISSGVLPAIPPGVPPCISRGAPPGLLPRAPSRVPPAISSGVAPGMHCEAPSRISLTFLQ